MLIKVFYMFSFFSFSFCIQSSSYHTQIQKPAPLKAPNYQVANPPMILVSPHLLLDCLILLPERARGGKLARGCPSKSRQCSHYLSHSNEDSPKMTS